MHTWESILMLKQYIPYGVSYRCSDCPGALKVQSIKTCSILMENAVNYSDTELSLQHLITLHYTENGVAMYSKSSRYKHKTSSHMLSSLVICNFISLPLLSHIQYYRVDQSYLHNWKPYQSKLAGALCLHIYGMQNEWVQVQCAGHIHWQWQRWGHADSGM